MQFATRLNLAIGISSFGSWLTFLAIGLLVKSKHGVDHVAYAFMIQAVVPFLFSSHLAKIVPQGSGARSFVILQLLSALALMILLVSHSLAAIYVYLIVSSAIKAVSQPLPNSLLGEWFHGEELVEAHTRAGAVNAATLALAPALGGFLSVAFGFQALFVIDALSFIAAAALLNPRNTPVPCLKAEPLKNDVEEHHKSSSRMPRSMVVPLIAWLLFIAVGGILNAIEFGIFSVQQFGDEDIGLLLGAWGTGNIIAMALAARLAKVAEMVVWAGIFGVSMTAFVTLSGFAYLALSFLIGGLSYAMVSGVLKAKLQQQMPKNSSTLPIWAGINQLVNLINIVALGGVGELLAHDLLDVATWLLISVSFAFVLIVGILRYFDAATVRSFKFARP